MYFYFEPYVYLHIGVNGVLLVNLLDDKSFLFTDEFSVNLVSHIQASKMGSISIDEEDLQNEIIVCSIENFLGDIITSKEQPKQFPLELNVLSGINAYKKTISYTKYDIYKNIKQCVVFISQNTYDIQNYISLKRGYESSQINFLSNCSCETDVNLLMKYIDTLLHLNSEMRIFLCGALYDFICDIPTDYQDKVCFVFSLKTLFENKNLWDYLEKTNSHYIIMINGEEENLISIYESHAECIWVQISGEKTLSLFLKLRNLSLTVIPFLMLNSENMAFIKSIALFSKNELLQLRNKYQIIKKNNLLNSNWWGNIYLFPNGQITYSLEDIMHSVKISEFCEDFKHRFRHGNFEWTNIRNYTQCKKCVFRWLCPSPSYMEDLLRKMGLRCLLLEY